MFEINWRIEEREKISATVLPKFNKNRREKEKKVERERRGISATLLPKFLCPYSAHPVKKKAIKKKSNCGNAIAEIGKKKIFFGNCGNGIAENGKKN